MLRVAFGPCYYWIVPPLRDVIGIINRKRKQLARLEAETAKLRAELDSIRTAVIGPDGEAGSPKAMSSDVEWSSVRRRAKREGSTTAWAIDVLDPGRRPLHVDQMIEAIFQKFGEHVKKPTLVSTLARMTKQGDTFYRAGSNTYGLLKWTKEKATG